nr:Muc19 precursor [uncultured bacterium]
MKKSVPFTLFLLSSLIPFLLLGQTQIPGGNVSGVWTASGSPYIIEGSITVDQDSSLIIKPGVTVKFTAGTSLSVNDGEQLLAIGTPDSMITFTSNEVNPSPGSWNRIYLNGTESGSTIQYSIIEYAIYGIYCRAWTFACEDADNFTLIENCEIRQTSQRAIFCEGEGNSSLGCVPSRIANCSPTINNNKIYENLGLGIYLVAWDGFQANGFVGTLISNNQIFENGSDAIRSFWNDPVSPVIMNNTFYGNGGSGVHLIGNLDTLTYIIENNIFNENVEGINSDNSLVPVIRYNNLWHNGTNYINLIVPIYDISFFPLFVDPFAGDFNLDCLSPCVDKGNPDSPLDPDGTRADMGALWFDHAQLPGTVSNDSPVCEGDPVSLNANDGVSYSWTGPNDFTSTEQNIVIFNTTINLTGAYTVVITDSEGCKKELNTEVIISEIPTAQINGLLEICNGDSTTLTASGGSNYQWNTGDTTAFIVVSPALGTDYMVTVSSDLGCADEFNVSIIVHDLPTAQVIGPLELCNGDSTTLTASGGTNYLWNTGDTTAIIGVNPSVDTEYSVTVTNGEGCSDAFDVLVVVHELPIAMIDGIAELCNGDSTTLTASGGVSYQWNTGDTTAAIVVSPTTDTSYMVTVTNEEGCVKESSVLIVVNELPAVLIEGVFELCNGDSTTLTASDGATYLWNTGDTTAAIVVSPIADTTFMVTVTNDEGCEGESSVLIVVNELPDVLIGGIFELCNGDSTTLTASGGATYLWNTGDTTAAIVVSPTTDTSYMVTVTNDEGCEEESSVLIVVNELPDVLIEGVFEFCNGDSTTLTASGGVSYQWNTGDTTAAIVVSPVADTEYLVTVTNDDACTAEAAVQIVVNELPVVTLNLEQAVFCKNESEVVLLGGMPLGGTYIGQGVTNNIFDPSAVGINTIPITYVFVDGNGCVDSASQEVVVELCVGVNSIVKNESMHLFPNPSDGNVTIVFEGWLGDVRMELVDVQGRVIQTEVVTTAEVQLKEIPSGVYWIKASNENFVATKKLMVLDL